MWTVPNWVAAHQPCPVIFHANPFFLFHILKSVDVMGWVSMLSPHWAAFWVPLAFSSFGRGYFWLSQGEADLSWAKSQLVTATVFSPLTWKKNEFKFYRSVGLYIWFEIQSRFDYLNQILTESQIYICVCEKKRLTTSVWPTFKNQNSELRGFKCFSKSVNEIDPQRAQRKLFEQNNTF